MIIEHIVSQHAEESAFLWLLRDSAIREPHYDLADLKELESRVSAHLDGLHVAGSEAWPFCEAGLNQAESGEVFTAAYVALDQASNEWLEQTLAVVAEIPETLRGLVSALGWLPQEKLQGFVVNWLKSDQPLNRLIGLCACSIQRVDCGGYLKQGIEDSDVSVCSRALRNVGEIRRRDLLPLVIEQLNNEDPSCRFWAAWSATLLGDEKGLSRLSEFYSEASDFQHRALSLGLRVMDRELAVNWVREHAKTEGYERAIIEAIATIGDPVSIPWLITMMDKPEYSRLAAESFAAITGLDLAYQDMDTDQPAGFESGPTENPADEEVALDPDEELVWPDQQKISDWWSSQQGRFNAGGRYLNGAQITREQCIEVLKKGYQRQRRAAAMELAIFDQQQPLFNTSATAIRQSQLLK
ncbi:MAG: TIGR02270 family protein [Candidatus Thiodiazotropha weberae]|nr:TIGR02270 family protein [Candidatus Thiodiazotropha lotti]MCG8011832.1 TIGR02270 family protein [Candidatus Thiodiazotropha lotti]MCG8020645.1 TIGR02270 family protein [Candidatus Thiodiazotropha lotti]MCW4207808.1 TIGR02270 family protein [Candidatus Thiodiazotropha lotti]MCW4211299.1 TIGR02270 family protein [Candidatus Thiodiazotropha lotti]